MSRERPPQGTQALQRAFSLLRELQGHGSALPLVELARRTGLARPTAHRLLAAMEAEGLIGRDPLRGQYRLGRDLLALGEAALGQGGVDLPRTTPFHLRQLERHATRSWRDWSGYLGPTSYDPVPTREYFAIRSAAALIDVSPLFKVDVEGPQALDLVQRTFTRDFSKCALGQVMYTAWCDDRGRMLQDGNVVRLGERHFRVTSAHPCLRWLEECGYGLEVALRDRSEEIAALALQGPRARAVLVGAASGAEGGERLRALRYFRATTASLGGVETLITRTGFTGDLGYELWVERKDALALWDHLLEVGEGEGLLPAGLLALDMTRIEAGLILIDVDFVAANLALTEARTSSPYEAGIGWTVKLERPREFVGRRALEEEARGKSAWSMVGIDVDWFELERLFNCHGLRPHSPGQPPNREVTPLFAPGGAQVGQATSQVFSPLLKRHIGLASVRSEWARPGTELELELLVELERVRARARVAATPFFDPARKRGAEGERGVTRGGASP